jgi:hypothetical protein
VLFFRLKKDRGGIPVFTREGFNGMFFASSFFFWKEVSMWIRNEDRNGQRVIDEVEIGETLWVEILDEKGVEDVQPGIKRECNKNLVPLEACMEKADD